MVLAAGPELIEDVKGASDDVLSGIGAELEVRRRAGCKKERSCS